MRTNPLSESKVAKRGYVSCPGIIVASTTLSSRIHAKSSRRTIKAGKADASSHALNDELPRSISACALADMTKLV
jgi:hypothetical protein